MSKPKYHCSCRKTHTNCFMIECGDCITSFHGRCVGVEKDSKETKGHWSCFTCIRVKKETSKIMSRLERLEKTVEAFKKEVLSHEEKLQSQEEQEKLRLAALKDEVDNLTMENKKLIGTVEDLKKELSCAGDEKNKLLSSLEQLKKENENLNVTVEDHKKELLCTGDEKNKLLLSLEQLKKGNENLNEIVKDHERVLKAAHDEKTLLLAALEKQKKENQMLLSETSVRGCTMEKKSITNISFVPIEEEEPKKTQEEDQHSVLEVAAHRGAPKQYQEDILKLKRKIQEAAEKTETTSADSTNMLNTSGSGKLKLRKSLSLSQSVKKASSTLGQKFSKPRYIDDLK